MTTPTPDAMLRIGVLGPLIVTRAGQTIELSGSRQRRLLSALVVVGPEGARAEQLAEMAWDDADRPARPDSHVRTLVSRLRARLDGADTDASASAILNRSGGGYRVDADHVDVDSWRFEQMLAAAERRSRSTGPSPGDQDPESSAIEILEHATALFRGRPFEDLPGVHAIVGASARLEQARLDSEERVLAYWLEHGSAQAVVSRAAALLEEHPFREQLKRLEVTGLYRSGRQAEAISRLAEHRLFLVNERGLDPSPELAELEQRILIHDPELVRSTEAGVSLRSYRLSEELGRGAFAIVHKGVQPGLNREVAVKVIRAEYADRPEFIRSFEAEAHLVARLEHPHIVPLYDYWREPGRACLVFRYLRGGTLQQLVVAQGGLGLDDLVRLVQQVGGATSTAHARGVVHRDIKPANVLVDHDRNFYLGDFSIALDQLKAAVRLDRDLRLGSPAYAAPEQLRRESVGPVADIYSLGTTLFEAMTGQRPYGAARTRAELIERQLTEPLPLVSETRRDLPAGVDDVLATATAKAPRDRFQTVDELLQAMTEALGAPPLGAEPVRVPTARARAGVVPAVDGDWHNPFKGLRPFTAADADDFFGREDAVERVVQAISRPGPAGKLLALVGPSGIGKSSIVRAGVLPQLRRGVVPGSSQWFTASMVPGTDPYAEFANAILSVSSSPLSESLERVADDQHGLARVIGELLDELPDTELVLLIDQFEELFTQSTASDVRRFIDALVYAVEQPGCRLRVIVTIRADFWDRPLRHAALARLLDGSTVHVSTPRPDELERAIVEPVRRHGRQLEAGLVSQILAEVADQPMVLPLLQFALTELWQQSDGADLTVDHYEAIGGVAGAIARHADRSYGELDAKQRESTHTLFSALVTPGDGGPDTRRRVLRRDLDPSPITDDLVARFGNARLLAFDRHPSTREPTVELAHEALLRTWPRLRGWIDQDRERLRLHRHLGAAAQGWAAGGRHDGDLYRGPRLAAAQDWGTSAGLTQTEQAFLESSIAAQSAEEEARQRQIRRLRRSLVSVAVVAVVAVVAGVLAVVANGRAEQARQQANESAFQNETLVLAGAAERIAASRPDVALQLAVAAVERQDSARTRNALFEALNAEPRFDGIVARLGDGCIALNSNEATVLAAATTSPHDAEGRHQVTVARYVDGVLSDEARVTVPAVYDCAIPSPDGSGLLAAGPGGLTVLDVAVPDEIMFVPLDLAAVTWSQDGQSIGAMSRESNGSWTATKFDGGSLDVAASVNLDARRVQGIYLVNDQLLVHTTPPVVIDFATGRIQTLDTLAGFRVMALSPDGNVVVGTDGLTVQLFDVATGDRRWSVALRSTSGQSAGITIDPTGTVVAVDTAQGIDLMLTDSGNAVGAVIQVSGPPHFLDAQTLVVVDDDHQLNRFKINQSTRTTQLVAWDNTGRGGVVAPDGSVAWTVEGDQSVGIDISTGERFELPPGIFRAGNEGRLIGLDTAAAELVIIDGREERRIDLAGSYPEGLEGLRVPRIEHAVAVFLLWEPTASALAENHVLVVELASGQVVGSFAAPGVFLADQIGPQELVLGSETGVDRVVTLRGETVVELPGIGSDSITAAVAGPNQDIILGLSHGELLRWSRETLAPVETFSSGQDSIMALHPTDDGVIAQHASGEIVQWQWGMAEPIARLAPSGTFLGLAELSPDGQRLLVPADGGIDAIPISTASWVETACALVGATLDRSAWSEFTGLPAPEEAPCALVLDAHDTGSG